MVLRASARTGLSRYCRTVPSSLRSVRPQPPAAPPPVRSSSRLPSQKQPFVSADLCSSLRRTRCLAGSLPLTSCTVDSVFPLHARAWTLSRVSATDDDDGT